MDHEFWHERWDSEQIAFHQSQTNETLKTLWPKLNLPANADVLVPLCGKSLDILWLRDQGHNVVGVELSQLAVDAFFEENKLARKVEQRGPFDVSQTDGIEIWCGDFFSLPDDLIGSVAAVFDRGALVALPSDMRARYGAHLLDRLSQTAKMLLLVVEYDQQEMSGPPFCVTQQMVTDYYSSCFAIEQTLHQPVHDLPERFRERGLTAIADVAYILKRIPK